MELYRCSICLEFVADSIQILIKHIGRIHSNEPNFHVVCGIDSCAKTDKNFLSFRNHLIRKHNVVRINNKERTQPLNCEDDGFGDFNGENGEQDHGEEEFNLEREETNLSRANALCLLKFKEKACVPQTVVNSFVNNATQIAQASVDLLRSGVSNCLLKAGINIETIPGLNDLFEQDNRISNPFRGIDKEPLQYKYYKEEFSLVVSNTSYIKYYLSLLFVQESFPEIICMFLYG